MQEILLAIGAMPEVRCWRQNSGKFRSFDGKRIVISGIPGCADISGILSDGRRLEVECKTDAGRQSEQQKRFQEMIERYNGVYLLARSVDQAVAGVRRALDG